MRLKIRKIGPRSMKLNDDGTEAMEDAGKVEKVTFNKPNRKKRLQKRG